MAPSPKRAATAAAAASVASASRVASRASISCRRGVPWHLPMATKRASGAVLVRSTVSTATEAKPAAFNYATSGRVSCRAWGMREVKVGGSSGNSLATALTITSANSFCSIRSQTLRR